MKQETTPIIVIRDRMMILDDAMNNVSLVSSSPSKFPCSSSQIDVCTEGDCNGSSWKWKRLIYECASGFLRAIPDILTRFRLKTCLPLDVDPKLYHEELVVVVVVGTLIFLGIS